jgi:mannitol/fructose-specific phosphotransferase system IIA component (Ntr-type)
MKPEFAKHLDKDSIITLKGRTKKEILDEIIAFAATKSPLERSQIETMVWKREKQMTTGVGMGLAIPHIRVPACDKPLVIVGLCANPVKDYKSMDNEPVTLVVFLAAGEENQDEYLKLLGSISSKLKNQDTIKAIMEQVRKPAKAHKILTSIEA